MVVRQQQRIFNTATDGLNCAEQTFLLLGYHEEMQHVKCAW